MGILDRLFGRGNPPEWHGQPTSPTGSFPPARSADEQAIERYRYLVRTAPPETIEEAHAEAFAQLTPEQRRLVLAELSRELPERERAASAGHGDDPRSLARLATRAELRQPGALERAFGGMAAPGIGLGGLIGGSFLGSFAGMLVGSAIADQFFNDTGYDQSSETGEAAGAQDTAGDSFGDPGDAGSDAGGTGDLAGGWDSGGAFGGDIGGGDFGGDF